VASRSGPHQPPELAKGLDAALEQSRSEVPNGTLSEGVVLVSLFKTGYRVWEVGH
jgi:hypothetical protein